MIRSRNCLRRGLLMAAGGVVLLALAAGYGGHPWWRVGPMVFNEPSMLVRGDGDYWVEGHLWWDEGHFAPARGGHSLTLNVDVEVTNLLPGVPSGAEPFPAQDPGLVMFPVSNVEISLLVSP